MIIETIIKWAVPFVCGGIITWAVTYIKLRKKRDSALESGVQCLLRAEIIRNHDKYIDKGYCPIYAKEALKRAYAAYHNLGGNDVATQLYHQVMDLPTDPPHDGGNAK
nr:MAG TPA: minor structural protein [Caudoviricetes sp.]